MTGFSATDGPSDPATRDVPKVRQCLKCSAAFPSSWSGERVCARCRNSNAWRNSAPLRFGSSGIRR